VQCDLSENDKLLIAEADDVMRVGAQCVDLACFFVNYGFVQQLHRALGETAQMKLAMTKLEVRVLS
jgi:hypothetical protein